jgi:hypothetical protein
MKPEENYSIVYLKSLMLPPGDLPGIDNDLVIQPLPLVIRDDGYVLPTKPLAKRQWKLRYYLAYFCPWIGRDTNS